MSKSNKGKYSRGKLFTLYERKYKHGSVWYAQFRKDDDTFGSPKNTKQTTKSAAENWAVEYLKTGQVVENESTNFKEFATDFFKVGGFYHEYQTARKTGLSERQLGAYNSIVKNHLIPEFGKLKLTQIDYEKIAKLQIKLLKAELSGTTVNRVSTTIKIILTEAFKKKLIQNVPIIERVAINANKRGVLTEAEVHTLFHIPWNNFTTDVLNNRSLEAFTGNLLAASTGLRQGEIVALQRQSVFPQYLEIIGSWDRVKHRLKGTKTGKDRIVPIPSKVYNKLQEVMDIGLWTEPSDFVFFGESRDCPMNPEILTDSLYQMIKREPLEISEKVRSDRGITFHSWRHFFNSLLVNGKIPTFKVQSLTGHATDEMTENYYHPDDYRDVRQLTESFFAGEEN